MSFTNQNIDPASLPSANRLEWQVMPPEHRHEVIFQAGIAAVVLALVSLIPMALPLPEGFRWPSWQVPLTVCALCLLVALLQLRMIRMKGFALRDHDIAYRSGLYWHKQVILPFNRVQHVEVASGPVQRRFGLATLKFFTAGGASVDLKISGLLHDDANRLRAHILQKSAATLEH